MLFLGDALADVTATEVVVEQAHRLHKGIGGGGTDEFPPTFLQILGHGGGFGACGVLTGEVGANFLGMIERNVLQKITVQTSELLAQHEGLACVADNGGNFSAVADDASVFEKLRDFLVVVISYFFEIEVVEGGTEIFAFA